MFVYSKAAIALHNYIWITEPSVCCPQGLIDGENGTGKSIDGGWRRDEDSCVRLVSLPHTGSNSFVNPFGK